MLNGTQPTPSGVLYDSHGLVSVMGNPRSFVRAPRRSPMRSRCFSPGLLLVVALAAGAQQSNPADSAASQNPATAAGQATSREIQLVVMVNDKAGHAISGLERGDFTLLDNNHPTQIDSFNG